MKSMECLQAGFARLGITTVPGMVHAFPATPRYIADLCGQSKKHAAEGTLASREADTAIQSLAKRFDQRVAFRRRAAEQACYCH